MCGCMLSRVGSDSCLSSLRYSLELLPLHLVRFLDLHDLRVVIRDDLTEEEQMKKLKEAETRRLRMQKIRKDNVENRKARIRATTGSKYRDGINRAKGEIKVRSSIVELIFSCTSISEYRLFNELSRINWGSLDSRCKGPTKHL